MKQVLSLCAVAALTLGGFTLVGCESTNTPNPSGGNAGQAGGNGAFGESPKAPGSYNDADHPNSVAPSTQPAY